MTNQIISAIKADPKAIFVVLEADFDIGTGHLMRVKGLLPCLIKAGYRLYLISDSFDRNLKHMAPEYTNILLHPKNKIPELINSLKPQLTLIDHYHFSYDLERQIEGKKVVIDDLKRKHDCDLLTDSCFFTDDSSYRGKVPADCKLLTGPQYSLIREEFLNIEHKLNLSTRVLINYGGSDPAHACLKAVLSIMNSDYLDYDDHLFSYTVLAGAANDDIDELYDLCCQRPDFEFMVETDEMGKLFSRCDLAMGAYGGTFKERMAAGIPSLGTVIAQNQEGGPLVYEKYRCGLDIDLYDLENPLIVGRKLLELGANSTEFAENGKKLISGNGIKLVSDAILKLLVEH